MFSFPLICSLHFHFKCKRFVWEAIFGRKVTFVPTQYVSVRLTGDRTTENAYDSLKVCLCFCLFSQLQYYSSARADTAKKSCAENRNNSKQICNGNECCDYCHIYMLSWTGNVWKVEIRQKLLIAAKELVTSNLSKRKCRSARKTYARTATAWFASETFACVCVQVLQTIHREGQGTTSWSRARSEHNAN